MKYKYLILFISLSSCCFTTIANPDEQKKICSEKKDPALLGSALKFIYSYVDFNLNSTSGSNFNRFQGHSNMVGFGVDKISLPNKITGGVYVYHIDTTTDSQSQLSPNPAGTFTNKNKNDTLYGHLARPIITNVFGDIGFGYGNNQMMQTGIILNNQSFLSNTYSNYQFNNWLLNGTLMYQKSFKRFTIFPYVQGLYTYTHINNYNVYFSTSVLNTVNVQPLTTKVTYLIEGLNAYYQMNNSFTPYIGGSLIQIPSFKNSRPTTNANINGTLPQLALNQDGYRLNGGLMFSKNKWAGSLEYRYYKAGSFKSEQALLNVTLSMD